MAAGTSLPTPPRPLPIGSSPGLRPPSGALDASGSFVSAYLSPRMSARLVGFGQVVDSALFRTEPTTSAWRGDVARAVEKQALRAARGAAREYLVDRWDLEFDLRRDDRHLSVARARDARASGLRLGFVGLRPRLTWQAASAGGTLKVSLDGRGRLAAAWSRAADRPASLAVTLDPSHRRVEGGWRSEF